MMVTRRNAVSQVVAFMSIENGLILAATGAQGMPLVVEISVAFSVLVAFIVIGIFLFRIRERFDTRRHARARPLQRGAHSERAAVDPVLLVLLIPLAAAALLIFVPSYRLGGAHQHRGSFLALLAALSLFAVGPSAGHRCCSTNSTSSSLC